METTTVKKKKLHHYFGIAKTEWKISEPSEATAYATSLQKQLEAFAQSDQVDKQEWLRAFYNRYTDRFTKDNEKIWTTAAIFIPLSLVGLSYFNNVSLVRTVLIAIGSVRLMEFWVNVAEHHRAFQQKSQVVATVIEKYIGLNFADLELDKDGKRVVLLNVPKVDGHPEITNNVQVSRWKMLYYVRMIWCAAILGSAVRAGFKTHEILQARETTTATPTKVTTIRSSTIVTTTTTTKSNVPTSSIVDLFL